MTNQLNTNLQAIADLCKEPRVDCPCFADEKATCRICLANELHDDLHCLTCKGVGLIPDPKLKGLLKVVQDECTCLEAGEPGPDSEAALTSAFSLSSLWWEIVGGRMKHITCGATGYIVAPIWQGLIDQGRGGALKGALSDVILKSELSMCQLLGMDVVGAKDDLAATEVIKKWLEESHVV